MTTKTYEVKVYEIGVIQWFFNYQRHRENGPAVINAKGDQQWFQDGVRHRTDGPAVECVDGYKAWYLNGKRHRTDGPAIIWSNGNKTWYLNDRRYYTEYEYRRALGHHGKIIEVGGRQYCLTMV